MFVNEFIEKGWPLWIVLRLYMKKNGNDGIRSKEIRSE